MQHVCVEPDAFCTIAESMRTVLTRAGGCFSTHACALGPTRVRP